jgi:hypothetical protein
MKINDFVSRIVAYYKSGMSIHVKGKIGRGKSSGIEGGVKAISKELGGNYGCVVLNAPLMNPPDTVGYLMPKEVGERMESVFTEPFWFRTEEGKRLEEYDGGIIFVDELDKADPDVKKILGEMKLSGRLGPHRIPGFVGPYDKPSTKGWRVWSAGNHPDERSGATKEYDHLINRHLEIVIDDDIDAVTDWMTKNDVHPVGLAFAHDHASVLFSEPPKVQGPWCTPRSFVQCFKYLASLSTDGGETLPSDDLTMEECAGMIGSSALAQLSACIRLGYELPKFQEIVDNPKKCKMPDSPDAQMLVCYSLAYRVDEKTIEPVMEYVKRMPAEFTVVFGKSAVARKRDLINTKAFSKWCSENSSLMLAITDVR